MPMHACTCMLTRSRAQSHANFLHQEALTRHQYKTHALKKRTHKPRSAHTHLHTLMHTHLGSTCVRTPCQLGWLARVPADLFARVEQHGLLGHDAQHTLVAAPQREPDGHVLARLLAQVPVDGLQPVAQRALPLLLHVHVQARAWAHMDPDARARLWCVAVTAFLVRDLCHRAVMTPKGLEGQGPRAGTGLLLSTSRPRTFPLGQPGFRGSRSESFRGCEAAAQAPLGGGVRCAREAGATHLQWDADERKGGVAQRLQEVQRRTVRVVPDFGGGRQRASRAHACARNTASAPSVLGRVASACPRQGSGSGTPST